MRFWDSSALVPLVAEESTTAAAEAVLDEDPEMALWWGSAVECTSAFARSQRLGEASPEVTRKSLGLLLAVRSSALEIEPSEEIRGRAMRLLTNHPLRAGDALQLAAALAWCEKPAGTGFVCFDQRLREAAQREGFEVLPGLGPGPALPATRTFPGKAAVREEVGRKLGKMRQR